MLHKSSINSLVGDWINEVQTTTVSLEARYNLALYELQHGAVEDMNVRNYGSTILTNPEMRLQLKKKAELMLQRELEVERRKAVSAEAAQQKAGEDETAMRTVVDTAYSDCVGFRGGSTFSILGMERENARWKSLAVQNILKPAARALVPPVDRARGNALPSTKNPLQTAVTPYIKARVQAKFTETAAQEAAQGGAEVDGATRRATAERAAARGFPS